ncbi:hypothetical protein JTE90_011059 [Oedothorax gibbosus]|uniref:Uncharacterized protein n=1 Tax=Oedothorax gibbosus TaxID=931172 RepID=A0AAV6VE34_9ARAC|nr:hypothetical protein JTE90_011059 [Oedothorax gibbosus]
MTHSHATWDQHSSLKTRSSNGLPKTGSIARKDAKACLDGVDQGSVTIVSLSLGTRLVAILSSFLSGLLKDFERERYERVDLAGMTRLYGQRYEGVD